MGLLLAAGLCLPAGAGPGSQRDDGPAFSDRLGTLVRQVDAFPAAEYGARSSELLELRPVIGADALILQAGAPLPRGLAVRRAAELEDLRTAILADMRGSIDAGEVAGGRWLRRLVDLLDPAHTATDPELTGAAMRVAAVLDRHELGPWIAERLEDEDGRLAVAARAALFELYGVWLENRAGFERLPRAALGGDAEGLRELLASQADERLGLWSNLLALDSKLAVDAFDQSDPRVRVLAARAVQAGQEGVAPAQRTDAIGLLEQRLLAERDPAAYAALLDALTRLGYGIEDVRAFVLALEPGDLPVHLAHQWLGPLGELAAGPAQLEARVSLGSRLFERGYDRPLRADDLAAALDAWSALLPPDTSPSFAAVEPVLVAVRGLLADSSESKLVRQAAVRAHSQLGALASVRARSLQTLEDPGAPAGLRVAAWGVVAGAADALTAEEVARALPALRVDLDAPQAEVAQAAFQALTTLALRPELDESERAHALRWTARQLASSTRNGRTEALIDLLSGLAPRAAAPDRQAALAALVAGVQPEALLRTERDRLGRMRVALGALAEGSDPARLSAARWLVSAHLDETPELERRARLESALRLVIGHGGLGDEGHAVTLDWAEEYLFREPEDVRRRWLERSGEALLTVHGSRDRSDHPHLFALALAHAAESPDDPDPRATRELALERFGAALAEREGQADPLAALVVRRDRARLLATLERKGNILYRQDLEAWLDALNSDAAADRAALLGRLGLADIEALAERAAALEAPAQEARLRGALVGSAGWADREPEQRRLDLDSWVGAARRSADPDARAALLARFEHLPIEGAAGDGPWSGLAEDEAGASWLLELRSALEALPRATGTQTPSEGAEGGEETGSSKSPSHA